MTASPPDNLRKYAETRIFTKETIPGVLLKSHRTNPESWGQIVILSGALLYIRAHQLPQRIVPGAPGTIVPNELHRVETAGAVTFRVDFYRAYREAAK
ncbi:DUF1971 domain-containing protein [Roseobacter sp. YSTF-M11]|uniref:DUF1971 domain-containing protein n=1 Tax=Roseobacter insulae TaxID=2859783 RepID=A0A9X1FTE9_9RHOB|nr:DUF1971 domain-containing protein [Roseobacter insulae]MBW4707465.1 DUF1971 domain-containing protein [Roseobacter insulae]